MTRAKGLYVLRADVDLRVMATTDLHMHILPYDYVVDQPSLTIGLARTAALIREARGEVANSILVDNGDFLNGTPMGDELARATLDGRAWRRTHPIVAAMARLGYDAMTLGNHDFDHGAAFLGQVLEQVDFPVVCSNITLRPVEGSDPAAKRLFTVPFAILDRDVADSRGRAHPLRIGILGFLPPGSISGLSGGQVSAEIRDIVRSARAMVPYLRSLGADIVLALAHSGIGADTHVEGMENAVVPLAAVDGIDAIISGHDHRVFPGIARRWSRHADPQSGRIHGTPVVAPGFWGSHLGIIDLRLKRRGDGRWSVITSHTETRAISVCDPETGEVRARVRPEPAITRMMEPLHDRTLRRVRQPVGETRRHLHSYFAMVAPSPALDLVHRAKAWYATRRIAGTPLAGLPLLTSTAPFKAGGLAGPEYYTHIPPGPITLHAVAGLYLYPNDICALRLTGAELVAWLERAAGVFNRVLPGAADQPLIAASTPAYFFESVAGVDYRIDLSAPARYAPDGRLLDIGAGRVREITLDGAPLDPGRELLLVTNSFRIAGGGRYPMVEPSRIALDLPVGMRDVIVEYLAATGAVTGSPYASWRFSPVPGASVQFASAPLAAAFLDELDGLDITPGEIGEDGFMRFRLTL